ncbi:hypothetical protein XENTR_v10018574 [Xenopus tropicalis]|nr:hypothetical protein XENTR_v10018574 [Xenopus tropicalis]
MRATSIRNTHFPLLGKSPKAVQVQRSQKSNHKYKDKKKELFDE